MEESNVLKKVVDTVTDKTVSFEMDIRERNVFRKVVKKKQSFEIRPLTLSQLQRISKIVIDIELKEISADVIYNLIHNHAEKCAEIAAIAVSESRETPSKKLKDLFFHNLDQSGTDTILKIVFQQMDVINFTNTIVSVKTLNVLERKTANVPSVETKEASPIVPGSLSAVL